MYAVGEVVFFGGEDSELMVWKMGTDRIRVVEAGTEKGVMKILGW